MFLLWLAFPQPVYLIVSCGMPNERSIYRFQCKLIDAVDGSGRGAAFVAAVAVRLTNESQAATG